MLCFNLVSFALLLTAIAAPCSTAFELIATSKAAAERLLGWLKVPAPWLPAKDQQVRGITLDIRNFRYEQCGAPNSPVRITTLKIGTNDAFALPGSFSVDMGLTLDRNLSAPLRGQMQLYKKEFIWIKLPCQIGPKNICTIPDLCELLPPPPCPSVLTENHIPCECPASAGSFEIKNFNVVSTSVAINVPGWLVDGDYKVELSAYDTSNVELGCMRFFMHISRR